MKNKEKIENSLDRLQKSSKRITSLCDSHDGDLLYTVEKIKDALREVEDELFYLYGMTIL